MPDWELNISHMRSMSSKKKKQKQYSKCPLCPLWREEEKNLTKSLKISFLEWDRVYTRRMQFTSLSCKYLSPLIYLIRTRHRLPEKKIMSSIYQNALGKKDNIHWNWRAIWVLEFVAEQWLVEIPWLNNVSDWYAWDSSTIQFLQGW